MAMILESPAPPGDPVVIDIPGTPDPTPEPPAMSGHTTLPTPANQDPKPPRTEAMSQSVSHEQFENDVIERCYAFAPTEPGLRSAINWSNFVKNVGTGASIVDHAFEQAKPFLDTLLPPQYAVIVNLAAALVHGAVVGSQTPPATA